MSTGDEVSWCPADFSNKGKLMNRFFYAFKWQTVVETIKDRAGIVLLAAPDDDSTINVLGEKGLGDGEASDDLARVVRASTIYDDAEVKAIINAFVLLGT